jgi:hypothetical protein
MASIGEDIRSFLIGSTAIATHFSNAAAAGVIEQNTIRESAPSPRIWFQRDEENEEADLSGERGLVESAWNIEVHSTGDDERFNISDAIKRVTHGDQITMGSRKVQSVRTRDHDDDYVPRGIGSEEGVYVSALHATIWFDST